MESALPRKVFERELGQMTLRELFQKNEEGDYVNLDTTVDRDTCQKRIRIPKHQRYNKWNAEAKETIIDSIFKNYIIGLDISNINNCGNQTEISTGNVSFLPNRTEK